MNYPLLLRVVQIICVPSVIPLANLQMTRRPKVILDRLYLIILE